MTIRTSRPSASNLAGRLRGFGPMGVVAALVIIALGGLGGVLVLAWARISDQGFDGAVQATITGLAFGTAFAITGRLWGVIFAHAAFDVTAVAIIYFDCELAVARFFFN